MAVFLDELGELAAAMEQGGRALEIVERGFGPDHPRTALVLSNYSEYLARGGRWDEASDAAGRALAIFEREADPGGMFAFVSLTALGTAHLGAGRSDEALPILARANRIGEASAPSVAYLARARFALGRALWEIEGERARAGPGEGRPARLRTFAAHTHHRAGAGGGHRLVGGASGGG